MEIYWDNDDDKDDETILNIESENILVTAVVRLGTYTQDTQKEILS